MSLELEFLDYIKEAVSPFHAVDATKKRLLANGYKELKEFESWNIELGKRYFVTRNDSSILAFNVPTDLSDISLNIAASHTDSPTFKVKPNYELTKLNRYSSISVEPYGGMIYSTFMDRPLSLAGRVVVKDGNKIVTKLVNIDHPLLVMPNQCIHFNREINSGYKYNPAIDLVPLMGSKGSSLEDIVEEIANVEGENLLSMDLFLYNFDRGHLLGANDDFILAPQIDNLESVFVSFKSLMDANNKKSLDICVAFDNEEVGSSTKQGAHSTFMMNTVTRVFDSLGLSEECYKVACGKSFMFSIDNAHAGHPNLAGATDELNRVHMNEGVVIKYNGNQLYTSDAMSMAVCKEIFTKAHVPFQMFANRSDVRGGSTLGNISQSQISIDTVDIGLAQLAMHSAMETAGAHDLLHMYNGVKAFYNTHLSRDEEGSFVLE